MSESSDKDVSKVTTDVGKKAGKVNSQSLMYTIEDNPPWHLSLLLGLQHYLTMFGAALSVPIILSPAFCINDNVVTGKLISSIFFMSGIATLLQTTFGNRLPIVQGSTFSYLVPTFAILSLPEFACPEGFQNDMKNSTYDGIWKIRMREVQGAIMVSSLFQIVIGFTGLVGFLLRFIGPLTISPTIALVGLSLIQVCSSRAGSHWGISLMTIAIIAISSLVLNNVQVALPFYSREKGFYFTRVPLFRLFPVMIAILTTWLFCAILTASGAFEQGSMARTDLNTHVLRDSPWFRIPYPGQWGTPTVSAAGVFGMLAGVIAGIIESIGDYYACAKISGAPPPPSHAINRGIGIEGIACLLAGSVGTGNATTSFSENIGAIGVTRVGSRRVIQFGGICMIILALFGKFGALFSTIPLPIIGGVFCCMFGMITAVGISSLQFVNLNSFRNLFIIGFSLIFGLVVPDYLRANPNAIDLKVDAITQMFTVILSTSMVVGGLTACLLDNLIPGTEEERGLIKYKSITTEDNDSNDVVSVHCYDLPLGIGSKWQIAKYLPFLPYYPDKKEGNYYEDESNKILEIEKYRLQTFL